jgi:SHS2 domain-containing protein
MNKKLAGFQEHEHTADWELEVWAPTLSGLLEQAAHGMNSLSGIRLAGEPHRERTIQIKAQDAEGLLVEFLQELLYLGQMEGLGFDTFDMYIDNLTLSATLSGSPIDSIKKEIKAVTYHNLEVKKTDEGVKTRIVFDV